MPSNNNNNNNVLSIVYFSRKYKEELYCTLRMMNTQKLCNIDQICQFFQGDKEGQKPIYSFWIWYK